MSGRAYTASDYLGTMAVLQDVIRERVRQTEEYGDNADLEDGTSPDTCWLLPFTTASATVIESTLRDDYVDFEEDAGKPTWVHLIREEVAEAFQESDPKRLAAELIQVAALCVSWVEKIDARGEYKRTAELSVLPDGWQSTT